MESDGLHCREEERSLGNSPKRCQDKTLIMKDN